MTDHENTNKIPPIIGGVVGHKGFDVNRIGVFAMRLIAFLLPACLTLSAVGCSYNPNFTADVTGIGDLPQQKPGLPTFRSVMTLPTVDPEDERPPYRIGPLDQVTVLVWGRPDLGSQVPSERESQRKITTVAADGTISLPFLDRMDITGMTASQAAQLVLDAYEASVTKPQVELEVVKFRSQKVQITGEVTRPGIVYLSDNVLTIAEAMAVAGGTTEYADLRHGVLIRDGISYHLDEWSAAHGESAAHNVMLRDGDQIFFPALNENVFYVLGDVRNQGAYPIQAKGTTFLEGLGAAGGPNLDSAKLRPITFIRIQGDVTTVYKFELEEAMQAADIALLPGDRIYVSRTGIWYWGNVFHQLVPVLSIVSAAWFIDRLINE